MTPKEILQAALAKLGPNGEVWVQHEYAYDVEGCPCDYFGYDSRAVCWCGIGAIQAVVGGEDKDDDIVPYLDKAITKWLSKHSSDSYDPGVLPPQYYAWQDCKGRNFSDVQSVFKLAIKLAEGDKT